MNAQTLLATVNRDNVIRVYSGKPGCMCGCNGTYYADRAGDNQVNTVAPKQVTRVLTELKKFGDDLDVQFGWSGEVIFFVRDAVRHQHRNYVAYVKADGLDLTELTK